MSLTASRPHASPGLRPSAQSGWPRPRAGEAVDASARWPYASSERTWALVAQILGHFYHQILGHFTHQKWDLTWFNQICHDLPLLTMVMMSVLTNSNWGTSNICPTNEWTKPRMPASARSCGIFPRHQDVEITTPADSHEERHETRTHHLLNAFRCSSYMSRLIPIDFKWFLHI